MLKTTFCMLFEHVFSALKLSEHYNQTVCNNFKKMFEWGSSKKYVPALYITLFLDFC